MSKQIIFYGAGEYCTQNIDRWISEGLTPLCVADADIGKHNRKISSTQGDVEILPLDEAITRYPDYLLYLTLAPKHLCDVTVDLQNIGIPQERIRYADPYQWGLNCVSLDMLFIYGNRISFCCGNHVTKIYDWFRRPMEDFKTGLERLYEFRHELRELHKLGVKGPCEGCDFAKEGIVPVNLAPKPKSITFNTGFADDVCNLDCAYCIAKPRLANRYGGTLFGTVKQVVEFYGKDALPDLQFSCGEFFARKDAGEMLDFLADANCKISSATSASIYNESFIRLIRAGIAEYIMVSLDSGTRETYKKVKGRDFFDRVVQNLSKYSEAGLKIDLKYIFMQGENDGSADIEGFVEVAKRVKARSIHIAVNANDNRCRLPKYTMDATMNLHRLADKQEIPVNYQFYHFNPEDAAAIKKQVSHY